MRLVSEWQPQSGVIITWPHKYSDWADTLAEVEQTCRAMAAAISARQRLVVICYDSDHRAEVAKILAPVCVPENTILVTAASNDTWVRDYGPLSVRDDKGGYRLLDFHFNAWGGKFVADLDDRINEQLHQAGLFGATPMQQCEMILEGGSLDINDAGELLTTEKCLLSDTRNSGWTKEHIEEHLQQWLGVTQVHWLGSGEVEGDDTDAHIDTLARFADDNTILHLACDNPEDPHYQPLAAMSEELAVLVSRSGTPYRLVPLPIPAPIYGEGRRLPATHANFLIINDAVLLPVYNDPTDDIARAALTDCFADREIISIDCLPLIRQSGSLHCMTMQLAAGIDLVNIEGA